MSLGFNFLNMLGLGGIGGCGTGNTLGQLFSGTNSIFGCGYNNYNYVSCGSRGRSSASHGIGQYIGMAIVSLGMNLLGGLAGKVLDKIFNPSEEDVEGNLSDALYVNLFDSNNNLIEVNGVTPDYTAAYKTAMKKLSNKNNTEADKEKYAKQIVELYEKLNESDITQLMKSVKKQADEILK